MRVRVIKSATAVDGVNLLPNEVWVGSIVVTKYDWSFQNALVAFIRREQLYSEIADDLMEHYIRYPLWVAWQENEVVGFLEGTFAQDIDESKSPTSGQQGWVYHLATQLSLRRRGIGRLLMRTFVLACSDKGCEYVGLMCDSAGDLQGRQAFFEACGFMANTNMEDSRFMGAPIVRLLTYLK